MADKAIPDLMKKRASGISLAPVQVRGLRELAIIEGHLSKSRVVQRLVDDELARVLGPEWEATVLREEQEAA